MEQRRENKRYRRGKKKGRDMGQKRNKEMVTVGKRRGNDKERKGNGRERNRK